MHVRVIVSILLFANVRCDTNTSPEDARNYQRNQACTTPTQQRAKCISIYDCGVLFKAVQRQDADLAFMKDSQCGYDTQPLVCCGSHTSYEDARNPGGSYKEDRPVWGVSDNVALDHTHLYIDSIFQRKPRNGSIVSKHVELVLNETICGLEKEMDRVLGGTVTALGEYPWLVALEYKSKITGENIGIRCGGSLIHNSYVLTAAHCIQHRELQLSRAWLGDWDITTDPDCDKFGNVLDCADAAVKVGIVEETIHPSYERSGFKNDIGLLRLEYAVTYSDYIRPICLPASSSTPSITNLVVAGWGNMEGGIPSNVKQKVAVPLVPNGECDTLLRRKSARFSITSNQICAGGEEGKDSCMGDSGAPLMAAYTHQTLQQELWHAEGVVSYGIGCGIGGSPAVYTRVSLYVRWIEQVMKR